VADTDPSVTQGLPGPASVPDDLEQVGLEGPEEIGRGGFGTVYRCVQRRLDRVVAVKVFTGPWDAENEARFVREQRAMGRLSGHPNIVSIHEVGTTSGGQPYIVMHYHRRGTLESLIRGQPLAWAEVLRLGVKLAGALETAHRAGILHRDVKPANILLTDYGEPQLTDFGIAHVTGGFVTSANIVTGSPTFTAPEVLQGQQSTPASDVYSLAATLFCALTGHAAFERRVGEKLVAQFLRITREPIPDLRPQDFPNDLCTAIEQAMSVDPTQRPSGAAEFGEQLRAIELAHSLLADEMRLPAPTAASKTNTQTPRPAKSTFDYGSARVRAPGSMPAPRTRMRPPPPARHVVARARLLDVLGAGREHRLTLICGPSGFGKTTLAAQWRDELVAEGVDVAWLTIRDDDNALASFLGHIVEALRPIAPQLAGELLIPLQERGVTIAPFVLTTLIDALDVRSRPVTLVLDDWHYVHDPATIAALDQLLDSGPRNMTVVVTSRSRSGLPTGRMLIRDELLEIDAAALRFDLAETTQLLDASGLDEMRLHELLAATEGWPAALRLALLALRANPDPEAKIASVAGGSRALASYLVENVWDTMDSDLADFLMTTSITDRICGELAAALSGDDHAQARLEKAEEDGLFLERLDRDGTWYRYHILFCGFLRRRLARDHPDRTEHLHGVASEWYEQQGLVAEAVDHALAGGNPERATELVQTHGMQLLDNSQISAVLDLLRKLPVEQRAASPQLELLDVWAEILLQRPQEARAALQRFRAAAADAPNLRVEADVAEAAIAASSDQLDGVAELVLPCLDDPDVPTAWTVSVAANIATMLAIERFDFAAARRLQRWARPYHERMGGLFCTTGHCFDGMAAHEELDVAYAESRYRAAFDRAVSTVGVHSHAARLAGALLGELLYDTGRIGEAETLLGESFELGIEGGSVDFMQARYAIGARIKALRGDLAAAAQRLDEGSRAAATLLLPRLRARMESERLKLGLPDSPAESLANWPQSYTERRPGNGIGVFTAQLEDGTAICRLLRSGDPNDVTVACDWAQAWVDHLRAANRPRALLNAQRLLVSAYCSAGRVDDAAAAAVPLVTTCARHGLTRHLTDANPDITATLVVLRRGGTDRLPPDALAMLDSALRDGPAVTKPVAPLDD